jgi:hypothetical protein
VSHERNDAKNEPLSETSPAAHGRSRRAAAARSPASQRRGLGNGPPRATGERRAQRRTASAGSAEATPARNFYGTAVAGTDFGALLEARGVSGLEEEIALLRLQLRSLITEKPEDVRLVLQGINTLVRAVAAEYRLAGPDQQEMVRRMADAVSQLGGLMEEE